MAKINRAQLLTNLEAVVPGLSKKERSEQTNSFVFMDGRVYTYNDEIYCKARSGMPKDFEGAVEAKTLLTALNKFKDDEVEVEISGNSEFLVTGKHRKKFAVILDADITAFTKNLDKVEVPLKKDWKPLHENFGEAISIVQECAGKDESQFAFTCIHLSTKWVESCDNNQLTRYRIKTGIKQPVIVKRDSIKHISPLDMTHFAETDTWIHFRNPDKVQLSCKRHVEKYPDLTKYLKDSDGEITILPKGISDDVDLAEIFSKQVKDKNLLVVELKPGKMKIKGIGVSGWASSEKSVKYRGNPLAFCIAPALLSEITKRHTECKVNGSHLRVDGSRWTYVTSLGDPKEVERKVEKEAEATALAEKEPEEDIADRDAQWE